MASIDQSAMDSIVVIAHSETVWQRLDAKQLVMISASIPLQLIDQCIHVQCEIGKILNQL